MNSIRVLEAEGRAGVVDQVLLALTVLCVPHSLDRGFIARRVFIASFLQTSISLQLGHLIIYISNNKGLVDGFVRELTLAKRLYKHFR